MEREGPLRELDHELAALVARIDLLEARLVADRRVQRRDERDQIARIEGLEARLVAVEDARAAATTARAWQWPPSTTPDETPTRRTMHAEPVQQVTRRGMPPVPPVRRAVPPAPPAYPPVPAVTPTAWGTKGLESRRDDAGSASTRPAWSSEPAGPSWTASLSLRDLEERFAGRALAWTGGLALVAASIFFLSLAFSRGWITEELRVVIGLAAGVGIFGLGGVMLLRRNALMGHVLTAVGLGVTSITLMAGTRLYDVMSPEIGLLLALVAAIAAAVLAVRTNSVVVAAYGLIAALIAPPITGADPNLLTLGFVAVILVGTTGVALFRSWRWLPELAFVLAAPQLASWLTGAPVPSQALVALAGFWLVNVVAAAGEEVRVKRDDLRPASATLVLANATFLLWGGFVVLTGDMAQWRGTFVGIAAAAHLLVGAWFLQRQGLRHLFGNLVAGTGVACLTIAAFVQLGAPAVPLAWAAEAVALAWLAVRRLHRWSAVAALALAGLTVAHLVLLEYPLSGFGIPSLNQFPVPFQHAEAGSLAAVLLAIAVAVVLVPVRWVRSALTGLGVVLAAYAVTFELTGPSLVAALMALVVAGLLLDRLVARIPVAADLAPVADRVDFAWFASFGSLVAGLFAVDALVLVEYPAARFGTLFPTPFQHPEAASLAIVLAGLAFAGWLLPARWVRSALAGLGLLLVAYALPFELTGTSLVAGLVLLLPAGILLDRGLGFLREDPRFGELAAATRFDLSAATAGGVAWASAALYALADFIHPFRWGLETPPAVPFSDERTLVAALLAGSALAAARWLAPMAARRVAIGAALLVAAVVVPFEVYADGVAVLWVVLAGLAVLAGRWDAGGRRVFTAAAGMLVAGAAMVSFGIMAPPDRLWVVDESFGRSALLPAWPLAFVAVGLALYRAARMARLARWRTWLELAAGATGVYLVSVAVVDVFQRGVGGPITTEELAKQGQVALSVVWTLIGVVALVTGLGRQRPMLRHAGLGLLGLATGKVFVIDLAAMDVAYRAVVLAALGLLLLASAYLFTRFRGPRAGPTGIEGGTSGHA